MHRIYQISSEKYGIEIPLLTSKKKKDSLLIEILTLFIQEQDTLLCSISGLDFNVDKVISLINPEVLEYTSNDGICDVKFSTQGLPKLNLIIQYSDMFSEGTFDLYVFNNDELIKDFSDIDDLKTNAKIIFEVYDDSTYFEVYLKNGSIPKSFF